MGGGRGAAGSGGGMVVKGVVVGVQVTNVG
jgi:hypothetical protein